jgi:hypothetical protein
MPDWGLPILTLKPGRREGEQIEETGHLLIAAGAQRLGKSVPRTDCLTYITPKDMIPNQGAELGGYGPLERGREIRDASTAVEDKRLDKSTSRACVLAAPTAAAGGHGLGHIGLQFQVNQDLPQEEPRPAGRLDEVRILADKAETSPSRVVALEQGASVDVGATAKRLPTVGSRPLQKTLETREHHAMIISGVGITGYPAVPRVGRSLRRWPGPVVKADNDERFDPGHDDLEVASASEAVWAGKVLLLTMIAGLQPIEVSVEMFGRLGRGDADGIEAKFERVFLDPLDGRGHGTSIQE